MLSNKCRQSLTDGDKNSFFVPVNKPYASFVYLTYRRRENGDWIDRRLDRHTHTGRMRAATSSSAVYEAQEESIEAGKITPEKYDVRGSGYTGVRRTKKSPIHRA